MSYRNDHDAALLRIDALEQELGEVRSGDTKAKLAALEGQLAAARGKLERRRRIGWASFGMLVVVTAIGMASRSTTASTGPLTIESDPPPPTAPAVVAPVLAPRAINTMLTACVEGLDRVVRARESSGPVCVDAIRLQANDPGLGVDVRNTLAAWLSIEEAMRSDPAARANRDGLVPQIKAFVLPSFTR